jgi:hypothetical protein
MSLRPGVVLELDSWLYILSWFLQLPRAHLSSPNNPQNWTVIFWVLLKTEGVFIYFMNITELESVSDDSDI